MLTCKVGENIIDTFSYKDEKLREWSNRGMLKCPVCNEKMLYCHGDFKIPYFRHEKNTDCPDIYSEGITEEHLRGTQVLYEWLKTQNGIINLQLEKWIPETKQRPDIYFEREENGELKKYAIEFQCSPIATKYNERHDLYRLNNIKDIWILGTEKYDINKFLPLKKYDLYNEMIKEIKTKTIEREIKNNNPLLYLSQTGRLIKIYKDFKIVYGSNNVEKKTIFDYCLDTKFLKNCNIDNLTNIENLHKYNDKTDLKNKIGILNKYVKKLNTVISDNKKSVYKYYSSCYEVNTRYIILKIIDASGKEIYKSIIDLFSEDNVVVACNKEIEEYKNNYKTYYDLLDCCECLNNQFSIVNKQCYFKLTSKFEDKNYRIEFTSKDFNRWFNINKKYIATIIESSYTKPFRGKHGGTGWRRIYSDITIDEYEYEDIDINRIKKYIIDVISDKLRKNKYGDN